MLTTSSQTLHTFQTPGSGKGSKRYKKFLDYVGRGSAAGGAARRSPPVAATFSEVAQFIPQFAVVLESGRRQRTGPDCRLHRTARFAKVLAIREAAAFGKSLNIFKSSLDAFIGLPELDLAHPWGVDDETVVGEADQFAVAGGMKATVVAGPDPVDRLSILTEELVEQGRFADPG